MKIFASKLKHTNKFSIGYSGQVVRTWFHNLKFISFETNCSRWNQSHVTIAISSMHSNAACRNRVQSNQITQSLGLKVGKFRLTYFLPVSRNQLVTMQWYYIMIFQQNLHVRLHVNIRAGNNANSIQNKKILPDSYSSYNFPSITIIYDPLSCTRYVPEIFPDST